MNRRVLITGLARLESAVDKCKDCARRGTTFCIRCGVTDVREALSIVKGALEINEDARKVQAREFGPSGISEVLMAKSTIENDRKQMEKERRRKAEADWYRNLTPQKKLKLLIKNRTNYWIRHGFTLEMAAAKAEIAMDPEGRHVGRGGGKGIG